MNQGVAPGTVGAPAPAKALWNYIKSKDQVRLAAWTFAVIAVAGFVAILVIARHVWFTYDEWDFLAKRSAGNIHDLFRPHNEHLSTLPILEYRIMFRLVGLRSYVPYMAVTVLLHLTLASLLRLVMRRSGVGPWIATALASIFVFFGYGYENIVWGFQIGFVGSLVFGVTQLVLADHDGPLDRRDGLGMLAGGAGLLCSGVGVAMVAMVGSAALIRRGWRAALLHTIPLGVLFLVWYEILGKDNNPTPSLSHPLLLLRFVQHGFVATFEAIGGAAVVAIALAILLVVGLVLAYRQSPWAELRKRFAMPGAMMITALTFLLLTGSGRVSVFGPRYAASSRYLHIVAALMLPAIAFAAEAIVRRAPRLAPRLLVLLLIGLPGNLGALATRGAPFLSRTQDAGRTLTLALPYQPMASQVPRTDQPDPVNQSGLTIGWLLDAKKAGKLPPPAKLSDKVVATAQLTLSLAQDTADKTHHTCPPFTKSVLRKLDKGKSFIVSSGSVQVVGTTVLPGVGLSASTDGVYFDAGYGEIVHVEAGPVQLLISPNPYSLATPNVCV